MDAALAIKAITLIAKIAVTALTLFTSVVALIQAFACFKGSPFKEYLTTFKWLLMAILLNLIIN